MCASDVSGFQQQVEELPAFCTECGNCDPPTLAASQVVHRQLPPIRTGSGAQQRQAQPAPLSLSDALARLPGGAGAAAAAALKQAQQVLQAQHAQQAQQQHQQQAQQAQPDSSRTISLGRGQPAGAAGASEPAGDVEMADGPAPAAPAAAAVAGSSARVAGPGGAATERA